MADDTEETEENEELEPGLPLQQEEPVEGTEIEPALNGPYPQAVAPQVPQPMARPAGPPLPPALQGDLPPVAADSPYVPFRIGRRDPTTGEVTTVTGYGKRATPPDPNAQFWSRLRQRTANLPLDQTEAAVAAAMRFQGQRQYQNDLAKGMAPAEALARSAPLIFNSARQGSLGQAAQFMHAATPKPTPPRVRDVGGVLFRENASGGWDPLTPPKPVAPKVNPFDNEEYKSYLQELRNIEKSLNEPGVTSTERAALARRGRALQKSLDEIRGRYKTSATGTTGGNEVTRYTKDGRKAVFDSQTRKFIRYAE